MGLTKEDWVKRKLKFGPSGCKDPSSLANRKGTYQSDATKKRISIKSIEWYNNPENKAKFLEGHHKAHLGKRHDPEIGKKVSLAQKGYHNSADTEFKVGHVHSDEVKKRISDSKQGQIPWMKGRSHKAESNEKNRLAHTGKKMSDDTRRKMRLSQLRRFQANPELASYRVVALKHSEQGKTGYISRNQRLLYNFIKGEHPDAVLELPIVTENSVRYADVGVPSKRIDFEYDSQLHKRFKPTGEDAKRDEELDRVGWVTIRFDDRGVKALAGGRLNC